MSKSVKDQRRSRSRRAEEKAMLAHKPSSKEMGERIDAAVKRGQSAPKAKAASEKKQQVTSPSDRHTGLRDKLRYRGLDIDKRVDDAQGD